MWQAGRHRRDAVRAGAVELNVPAGCRRLRHTGYALLDLDQGLDKFLRIGNASARVAVLGIGNDLAGDDAVGAQIARELARRVEPGPDCLILDAGTAPENFTGPIRRFRPDLVLMVDAADLSAEPGATAWLDWQQTDGLSGSTHTLPPSVLARFLVGELACRLALLVIQPAHLDFGGALSPSVRRTADRVIEKMAAALNAPARRSERDGSREGGPATPKRA